MTALRKTFGVLIIIFLGMPILIAFIWAVGLTRAAVSPKFMVDVPKEIIAKAPDIMEEVLTEVDREDMVCDPNSRAWVHAIAQAKVSPKQLLSKTGVLDWLENELTGSFDQMGKMMRGEIPTRRIHLNMVPLKQALKSPEIQNYLLDIMKELPPCTEAQTEQWRQALDDPRELKDLPACLPVGLDSAHMAVNFASQKKIDDIPDTVKFMDFPEDFHDHFPRRLNPFRLITPVLFLLFLIPGFFIAIASLLGGTERGGFFRWMGVTLLIGAVISYGMVFLLKHTIDWGMNLTPEHHNLTAFEELVVEKSISLGGVVVNHLARGVYKVSGGVALAGLVFLAFSFIRSSNREEKPQPAAPAQRVQQAEPPQPPQAPQPPAVPPAPPTDAAHAGEPEPKP